MIGYAFLANEAASVGCYQHIVLYSYAAEVLIGLQKVEVEEILAVSRSPPIVDKGRYEVDSRLVGDDKAFLETTSHAQRIGAELFEVGAHLVVETYVDLSQPLHVVYVHAHHVTQSVGQEHGMGTCADGIICVAAHKPELFQPLGHKAAHAEMHITIAHSGASHGEHIVVTFLHDAVDVQLPLGESSAHGEGACVVAAIVAHGLCSGITKRESALFEKGHRRIAVHYLAVLREYRGKAHLGTQRPRYAVDLSAHVLLCHSRTRQAHGRGVHLIAYLCRFLKLGNLLGSLAGAHLHHGAYQCERGFVALARMMDAQQVGDGEHSVVAIGRQEVQGAPCGTRLAAKLAQGRHRSRLRNAHAGCHLANAVN